MHSVKLAFRGFPYCSGKVPVAPAPPYTYVSGCAAPLPALSSTNDAPLKVAALAAFTRELHTPVALLKDVTSYLRGGVGGGDQQALLNRWL